MLLWLGFGALTSILVAMDSSLLRLHSIATSFEKDHNIAKPRASVGHELEINILGYSLSVWRYLGGIDAARQRAAKDAADVTLQLDGYTALAETARQRELASRLRTGWQEVHALGEALMAARTANREEVARFHGNSGAAGAVFSFRVAAGRGEGPEALSVETHGSLQKTEIVTLSLLFFGLVIALATGRRWGARCSRAKPCCAIARSG